MCNSLGAYRQSAGKGKGKGKELTLQPDMKALRGSRATALIFNVGARGSGPLKPRHAPAALSPIQKPGTLVQEETR
jgi:hypothetical protein